MLSRIFALLWGIVFCLLGGAFCAIIAFSAWRDLQPFLFWSSVPARITGSEVVRTEDDKLPYKPIVKYQYTVASESYEGDTLSMHSIGVVLQFSSYEEASRMIEPYQQNPSVFVWVDPVIPSRAVLVRRVPWYMLVGPIPFLFVIFGLFVVRGAVRGDFEAESGARSDTETHESGSFTPQGERNLGYFLILFSSLFVLVGLTAAQRLLYAPWQLSREASTWASVQGIVEHSEILTVDSDEETRYKPDILYRYDWNGTTFHSSRWQVVDSSSSYKMAKQIVERFPAGIPVTVFLNPQRPHQALLDRTFRCSWTAMITVLLFCGGGATLCFVGIAKVRAVS